MAAVVNCELLKKLVAEAGGTTIVAYEADVGRSTIEKLMAGTYPSKPGHRLRRKILEYFKVQEDSLFPPLANGRRKAS